MLAHSSGGFRGEQGLTGTDPVVERYFEICRKVGQREHEFPFDGARGDRFYVSSREFLPASGKRKHDL